MIDLQQFCPKWAFAQWMEKPFSRAGYTWATDGKMLVRVPLRTEIEEHPLAPDVERVWPKVWPATWRQPKRRTLPAATWVRCDMCRGRGVKHRCPDCTCKCEECGGDGEIEKIQAVSVGERAIPLRYARLIVGLDWAELAHITADSDLLAFRFDGGEGIVTLLTAAHTLPPVGEI